MPCVARYWQDSEIRMTCCTPAATLQRMLNEEMLLSFQSYCQDNIPKMHQSCSPVDRLL